MEYEPTTIRNPGRTSVVETGSLVVAIILVLLFLVRPAMSSLGQKKSQLQQIQATYQNAQKDKEQLSQLVQKVHDSKADLTLVDEALPLTDRPTQVEVLLDSLVTASGMKTVELNFQPQDNTSVGDPQLVANPYGSDRKVVPTAVDLSVTGTMDQLKFLLQQIETNGRVLDVSNIEMTSDGKNTLFKLKLKAYSYVP